MQREFNNLTQSNSCKSMKIKRYLVCYGSPVGFASVDRVIPRSNVMEKKELTRNGKSRHSRQKGDLCSNSSWHSALRVWRDLEEFLLPGESERGAAGENKKMNKSREMYRYQILKSLLHQKEWVSSHTSNP